MSSICGVCRPMGPPVAPHDIGAMLDALDHWRADARRSWTRGAAGFGHLLLRTSARDEALPLADDASGLAITGDIRLDNREALASLLGIATPVLAEMSDGEIVLRAYRAWGEDAASRLRGDFAFAIWDETHRTLFCARDVFGIKPFYYTVTNGMLAFATEMKGLFALPQVDRSVDETWIGDYLHYISLDNVSTLYRSIKRLPPAHALIFGSDGARIRRYFAFDPHAEISLRDDREGVEVFRDALLGAIRRRAATPFTLGAELSGGLDSAIITAVAHDARRREGRELLTFSEVEPEGTAHGPGSPREAVELVRTHSGLAHTCLLAGDGGVLDALDWTTARADEPPRSPITFYNHAVFEAAAAAGVRVLLSGFGGNHAVSAEAYDRGRELLWRGEWAELGREAAATGVSTARAIARILVRELDHPLPSAMRRRFLHWKAYPHRVTHAAFKRRMRMWRRTYEYSVRLSPVAMLREQAIRMLDTSVTLRTESAHLYMAGRRMEYRYPMLDVDLVALYLSLPSRLKNQRGVDRYVFRESLEGWIPEDVRRYAGPRAGANPGSGLRMKRDEQELKARVRGLPDDSPVWKYVDRDRLLVPSPLRGSAARERHTEMLWALMLNHALRAR